MNFFDNFITGYFSGYERRSLFLDLLYILAGLFILVLLIIAFFIIEFFRLTFDLFLDFLYFPVYLVEYLEDNFPRPLFRLRCL